MPEFGKASARGVVSARIARRSSLCACIPRRPAYPAQISVFAADQRVRRVTAYSLIASALLEAVGMEAVMGLLDNLGLGDMLKGWLGQSAALPALVNGRPRPQLMISTRSVAA